MNALYCRVSTLDQKTDRQRIHEKNFRSVIEDTCSGAVPFFDREGGKKVKKLIEKKAISSLSAWSIDRLGRDLRDIINTLHYFNERKVSVTFVSQGLVTLDADGKENAIAKNDDKHPRYGRRDGKESDQRKPVGRHYDCKAEGSV